MAIKLSDVIKSFSGLEGQEIETWLDKVELVAQLQEVKSLSAFVPLFLDGAAFAVYQQFSPETKREYVALKKALLEAFAVNPFSAYEQFRCRKLKEGEAVDVYLADLRRLAGLFGGSSDQLLKCAFVVGLPSASSNQLRAFTNVAAISLNEVVEKARLLLACRSSDDVCFVANTHGQAKPWAVDRGPPICFRCNRQGHIARNCLAPKPAENATGEGSQGPASSRQ